MKNNRTNKFISLALAVIMLIGMMPMNVLTASAAEAVTYVDRYWDESTQTVISQQKTVSDYTVLTSSSGKLESGWYVLNSNITTTNVIEISGEVHIILMDGCTWIPDSYIKVNKTNKLYIYGQANNTGKIKSNGDSTNTNNAAIGSTSNTALGTITINGGTIDVNQPGHGAAIGCGADGNTTGDGIIINGGFVTAVVSGGSGGSGAAIGGNNKTTNGAKVTINGGTVTATYNSSSDYYGGTAIGAGDGGSATVTIRGGYITATNNASGRWAAPAIGADSKSATVTITGGTIIANSVASYTAASIGGSSATVTIDGGNIQTNDGVTAPKNSAGTALTLVTLTLNSVADGTVVTNIDGIEYGKRDVKTIGNKLYLYLPENAEYPTSITAGGKTYYRSGDTATYTDHIHSFTYQKVEGENKINAICGAAGCTLTDGYGGSVTVSAPATQIHTGEAINPTNTVSYSEDWLPTEKPEMVYTNNTDLGTATGTLMLGDAKIEITFDIVAEIKLNANGGNGTFEPLYTDIYGNLQGTLPADVEHNSLFFTGWADAASGGNTVTDATIFNGSTTIYAQFVEHQHSWTYEPDGDNKIVATCSNEDTHCPDTDGGTFTISAPTELYTDGVIAREAVIDNQLVDTAEEISAVTYSTADGKAPTQPGTYTASVTVEGATASVEFTLLSYAASVTIGSETKNYKTIDEAFDAAKAATAKDNCVVTLLDNITTDNYVDISSGVLTLDLNDHKIESSATYTIRIESDATVTITDSGENGTVKSTAGTNSSAVRNKGSLTIESGTFEGDFAVYGTAGSITLNDGVFNGNVWSFAGYTINGGEFNGERVGINCENGTLEINNGTFDNIQIGIMKGFVVLNGGEFTANNTDISGTSGYTFADILGEGKAYYNANGEMIVLADGQIQINEPFTVGNIADEIAKIKAAVEAYDIDTVTSADIQGISVLKEDIANVKASAGLTAEQTATLDASDATLDSLVEKLTEVGNEIKRIDAAVTAYDINTVKSSDKSDIEQLIADIKALTDGNNLSDSERELLENHDATLDTLLEKINETASEIARIVGFIDLYKVGFVKSSDKAEFQQIIADIKALTDGQNITEEERADLEFYDSYADELIAKIDEVAAEIARLENAVNAYDINAVKSSDKADIEKLIADIKALTDGDNITDEERTNLEALDTTLDNLLAKNSETAAEIARIEETVNAYDEATVKYSDYTDILQLIDDIKALTDGQNITDDERASLEALDAKADTLAAKIRSTADNIARIESAVNAYDIDTVKSSDKADIENLIARIKKLTDGDNITDEQRTKLEALDTTLDELLAKIDETADELARLEAEAGKYDEATVKSSDLEALTNLDSEILALALTDNVTAEEKAKLEELHDKVFGLITKIGDVSEEIVRLVDAVDAYVFDSVKSSDKADIEKLIADIKALTDGDNITDDERAVLVKADETADALLEKIADTAAEIKRIDDAANAYDLGTVTSADKADIEKLLADSKALQDGNNITEAEEAALIENDETLNALLEKIAATAEEIARIEDAVNGYNEETVKSSDAEAIDKLIEDIKALTDGKNITEDEKAALEALDATADELNEKIDEVAAEKKRIEDAVNGYSEETVKSSDTEAIEQLKDDIQSLIDSGNVTEEEIKALEETKADADALTDKIDEVAAEKKRIEDAVAGYNEDTVKSSDTEAIEQLKDDIQTLIDSGNVTEEEIKALEETKADADALTDKIDEVAAEKKRIEDAVAAYDEETVKSSDTEAIEQLKDDIQTLIDSGNVTEEEIKALEETKADADALTDKIEETAQAMADTADKADDFDPATVTSDDKEAIDDIIADIDEIIASGNATQEEIADLNETKAELNALIAKFSEATAKVEALGVEMEMFDKDRVTKFWEDEIEALIAEIETLLADPNMGTAEKAKLNEYKAQAEEMLEIINTPKEYISCRFFYLIWDCLTWKYNGILWLFSKIFGC